MIDQERLSVNFCGHSFQNPVLTASGTCGNGIEISGINTVNPSALGGFVTKAVTLEPREGNSSQRITEVTGGILNSIGLQNSGIDNFLLRELPWASEQLSCSDVNIIVNVSGFAVDDYVEVSKHILEFIEQNVTNVRFIELNVSCPNTDKIPFGVVPDSTAEIVSKVRAVVGDKLRLIVKLTPADLYGIPEVALAAEAAGADAISAINTIPAMDIDVTTKKPVLGNITGGLSGPAILPVGLKVIYDLYRSGLKIPIIGIGGISNWEDALKYILAGASLVGIGTAGMINPSVYQRIIDRLQQYCIDNDTSISALIGTIHTAP